MVNWGSASPDTLPPALSSQVWGHTFLKRDVVSPWYFRGLCSNQWPGRRQYKEHSASLWMTVCGWLMTWWMMLSNELCFNCLARSFSWNHTAIVLSVLECVWYSWPFIVFQGVGAFSRSNLLLLCLISMMVMMLTLCAGCCCSQLALSVRYGTTTRIVVTMTAVASPLQFCLLLK